VWNKEDVEGLERRLARFREELNLHVTVDLRCEFYVTKYYACANICSKGSKFPK